MKNLLLRNGDALRIKELSIMFKEQTKNTKFYDDAQTIMPVIIGYIFINDYQTPREYILKK